MEGEEKGQPQGPPQPPRQRAVSSLGRGDVNLSRSRTSTLPRITVLRMCVCVRARPRVHQVK